jgi:hypothetical protein
MLRIELLELRGRSAVAAAAALAAMAGRTAHRKASLLASAARDAYRLEREREPWAHAHAQLLKAGIATMRGDHAQAATGLRAAAEEFTALEMHLHATAARRRLGEILGGAAGLALVSESDRWMREQTIRDPAHMTSIYAPGLPVGNDRVEPSTTQRTSRRRRGGSHEG